MPGSEIIRSGYGLNKLRFRLEFNHSRLLEQQGYIDNANLLSENIHGYINYQLKQLSQLAEERNFYHVNQSSNWASMHIAESLFSLSDKKEIANYLDSQRNDLFSYSNNYANPLISYLLDTGNIAESRNNARLWYNTLLELQRYNNQQPDNDVSELDRYITESLTAKVWSDCPAILSKPQFLSNGGLFSSHLYQVNHSVRSFCQRYVKDTVFKRYLALADRFNRDLKGKFPFAEYDPQNTIDLNTDVLDTYFADYKKQWKEPENGQPLLLALRDYMAKNPYSGLADWVDFVENIDNFYHFYQQTTLTSDSVEVTLSLDFETDIKAARGQDQIVEWQFNSGLNSAIFPNGNRSVNWRPGEPLSLTLRWATGSEFVPLAQYGQPQTTKSLNVIFNSSSDWALFEWLQRLNQPRYTTIKRNLLEFSIPVSLKNNHTTSYTSQLYIALSAEITNDNGKTQQLSIPYVLPQFAPGLPGR